MRAEQVTLYRCDVCGLHYHQHGLAEQCCSDELSKCAWEGCTEPKDKLHHSIYCPVHREQNNKNKTLERLMRAEECDSWSEDENAPILYSESAYYSIDDLVDELEDDEDFNIDQVPEWEYCVKLLEPYLSLSRIIDDYTEQWSEDQELDAEYDFDLGMRELPQSVKALVDKAEKAVVDHWRSCMDSVYVTDRSRRWPIKKWVSEELASRGDCE